MARQFNGVNTNRLSGFPPITTWPMTMACWAMCANTTTAYALMTLYSSNTNHVTLATTAAGRVQMAVNDGTGAGGPSSTAGYAADTWFHACGVYTSNVLRTVYYNGGNSASVSQDKNVVGLTTSYIGSRNTIIPLDGRVAWATIWNVALTPGEILTLSKGVYPLWVRSQNIVAFYPLYGRGSAEQELVNGLDLAITGTVPFYPQPRILT